MTQYLQDLHALDYYLTALKDLQITNLDEKIEQLEKELQLLKTLQVIRNIEKLQQEPNFESAVDMDRRLEPEKSKPREITKTQMIIEFLTENPGSTIMEIRAKTGCSNSHPYVLVNDGKIEKRENLFYAVGQGLKLPTNGGLERNSVDR